MNGKNRAVLKMETEDSVPRDDDRDPRLICVDRPNACHVKRQADLITSASSAAEVIPNGRVDIRIAVLWPFEGREGKRI